MSYKITLLAEKLYILRSTLTRTNGSVDVYYYVTPSTWNKSPMEATIFQNYDAASGHLNMYHTRDKAPKGWADGSKEVIEVVPLYGEIFQSPNAKQIKL